MLASLIAPVICEALVSPSPSGFGLPSSVLPEVTISAFADNAGDLGRFSAARWSLLINSSALRSVLAISHPSTDSAERRSQTADLRELADTIYHEARHCQQAFWINAMVQQQYQNFVDIPNISRWPSVSATGRGKMIAAIKAAAIQPIPDEPSALIGIKRMAVGMYLWQLNAWRNAAWYPSYAPDAATFEQEIAKVRAAAADLLQHAGLGGTPIDVDAMATEPFKAYAAYASRPWENDAFFCGELASAYWNQINGLGMPTLPADKCSRIYERADRYSRPTGTASGGD
ncbi:hypothetical protein, partial [Paraburkholderia sediminicola]|uniref:hypothetical protein n=1 Tax=Paraburkholderia sediminicola TaxID=458836 RepID=UPI0038B8B528